MQGASRGKEWNKLVHAEGYIATFGVGVPAISKHLSHIFEVGELDKEVVVSKMKITTQHGASKQRIWQQITDIYAECSFDYDRNLPTTKEFYQSK